MSEEDKSRLYIKQEIFRPDGMVLYYYVPQECELEVTEMDIIDNPQLIEVQLAGKFWNGHGYIISIGLRHPDLAENMYINPTFCESLSNSSGTLILQNRKNDNSCKYNTLKKSGFV
jgi:hypothetical protein